MFDDILSFILCLCEIESQKERWDVEEKNSI